MQIPVYSSYIRRKDMDSVLNCLMTDCVSPGEYLEKFIRQTRETFKLDYVAAMRSPLSAMELALNCLGMLSGSKIAISALSPSYYIDVIKRLDLHPIWLDVEPETGLPGAQAMSSISGAAACVYFEGAGIAPKAETLAAAGIPLIEDVSQSFGAKVCEVHAGSIGVFSLMGLEGGNLLTSGGGALVYANQRREGLALKNSAESLPSQFLMADMNAALGYSQIREFEKGLLKRRELSTLFMQSLSRTKYRSLVLPDEGETACYGFPVLLSGAVKDVRAYARKKEIETALAFADSCMLAGMVPEGSCPNAASLAKRCVLFPLHGRIGKTGAQKIAKVLATLP